MTGWSGLVLTARRGENKGRKKEQQQPNPESSTCDSVFRAQSWYHLNTPESRPSLLLLKRTGLLMSSSSDFPNSMRQVVTYDSASVIIFLLLSLKIE